MKSKERLILSTAVELSRAVKESGISRTELADRIGVTRGAVSQFLSGERNLTLGTIHDILEAIGREAKIEIVHARG